MFFSHHLWLQKRFSSHRRSSFILKFFYSIDANSHFSFQFLTTKNLSPQFSRLGGEFHFTQPSRPSFHIHSHLSTNTHIQVFHNLCCQTKVANSWIKAMQKIVYDSSQNFYQKINCLRLNQQLLKPRLDLFNENIS